MILSSKLLRKCFASAMSKLSLRNSEVCELRLNMQQPLKKNQKQIIIQVPTSGSLKELQSLIKNKAELNNIQFKCEDGSNLPLITPIEVLLYQNFYLHSDNHSPINIPGQLSGNNFNLTQDKESLVSNLQLPAILRRDQVSKLIDLKYKKTLDNNQKVQMLQEEAKRIVIESLVNPQPAQRTFYYIEKLWIQQYNEIKKLNQIKKHAEQICSKRVKKLLLFITLLSFTNVMFIWSGTYIFYTWDIMQPIAYFIDAFAAIIITGFFFRMGRLCSHYNFKKYLFQALLPKVYKDIGFNYAQYTIKEVRLRTIEAAIKDHFISRF